MKEKYHGVIGIALIIFSVSWLFILPFIPLKSNRLINANLLTQTPQVLVFFGYPSCRNSCSPILLHLQKIYENCANPQHLSVVFVNLWLEMSLLETQRYLDNFHNDFIGLAFSKDLNQQFGIWFIPQADGQIIHNDYIFLLENINYNQWIIKEVFKETISEQQLSQLQCFNRRI